MVHEPLGAAEVRHTEREPVVTIPGLTGPVDEDLTVSDTEADEMEDYSGPQGVT